MNKRALLENLTPEQRGALVGGLVGAGGAGLAGAMGSGKNKLRNSLLAALAGGAGGAGLGYFAPGLMGQGEAKEQAGPPEPTPGERGEVGPQPGTPGELGQVGPSRADGLAAGNLVGGGDSQKLAPDLRALLPGALGTAAAAPPYPKPSLIDKLTSKKPDTDPSGGMSGNLNRMMGITSVSPPSGTALGLNAILGTAGATAAAAKYHKAMSEAAKPKTLAQETNPAITPFKELQPGSNLPASARASNTSETPEAARARGESDAGHERALKRDNYAPQRDASGNVVGYGPKRPEYITGGKPQPKPGAGLPKMVGGAGFGNPLELNELLGTYNQLGGR